MKTMRLLDVCDVYQPQTIATKYFVPDGKYTVYGANGVIGKYNKYNHENQEVLMACRGATCGAINVSEPFSWINGNAMVIHPNGTVALSKEYLKYYLMSSSKDSIISGTAQPQITRQNLKDFQIVICDLDTQQQIVSYIEESLSQLDSAVETLKKTKQQLEVYRQAVLKEAFEGQLTHSEIIKDDILLNYIEKPRYGTSKKCTYLNTESTTSVYRIPNIEINQMRINKEDIKFAEFTESELEPIRLYKDDILIIRSNGSASLVGRAAIINHTDTNATFAGYLMRLRIVNKNELLPKYLLWYLQSSRARVYIEGKAKSTSGVHNINTTEISSLAIPIFDIDEQNKIVEAIESRISVFDTIEHTVNQSLQQAEALRQSILKQAFEGRD